MCVCVCPHAVCTVGQRIQQRKLARVLNDLSGNHIYIICNDCSMNNCSNASHPHDSSTLVIHLYLVLVLACSPSLVLQRWELRQLLQWLNLHDYVLMS